MASKTQNATQQFVPIKEIRNGTVILKDGSYRGILLCSSVNFGLKSADEQRAIISGFQNFLNTLDFSIQITVHSRKMDLRPYLALLEEKASAQRTDLMRLQLREYMEFIRSFADRANIMTKSFYIVVPYAAHANPVSSASSFLHREKKPENENDVSFEEARAQLEQRLSLVAGGLASAGIRAVPLDTEEEIELFYRSFNPGELENPIRLDR